MEGLAESNIIRIRNVFAIDALPKLSESIPSNNDVERYEHLRGLHFPEVHSKERHHRVKIRKRRSAQGR